MPRRMCHITLAALAIALFGGVTIAWSGAAEFTKLSIDAGVDMAVEAKAADLDGDGDLDVIGSSFRGNLVRWWENTGGDASAWTAHTVVTDYQGAAGIEAGDLDGDGDLDLVLTALRDNEINWFENANGDGSVWVRHLMIEGWTEARTVDIADFDGDGDLDVAGGASVAADIYIFENTAGDGSAWTQHVVHDNFVGVHSVRSFDMDLDGDMDVLGAATGANDVIWWENTLGDGTTWLKHVIDPSFRFATFAYAGDLDGDGDMDVAASSQTDWLIAFYENTDGLGTAWTQHILDTDARSAIATSVADMDADGDLDILATALLSDEVTWYENLNSDGSAWAEHTIDAAFAGAHSVEAVDLDADGDLDVLAAGTYQKEVAWWSTTLLNPFLGGTITGFNAGTASCKDSVTKETVTVSVVNGAWDCTGGGLPFIDGRQFTETVNGTATGTTVTGTFVGATASKITCENLTTGLQVSDNSGATSYDCAALGLLIQRDDRILITFRGFMAAQ